nr:immunoglobulin light chain junction region [Macaca mulatta]MOX56968.1 immunoglobulin light chain junction region [Macaca mulatta]
CQQYHDMVFTF